MRKISGIINITLAILASLLFIGTAAYGEASQAQPAAAYTEYTERKKVIVCGTPFGIKMLTEGVVVTDFGAVNGRISQQSPAEAAGVRRGDIITSVNGVAINDSEALALAVQRDPVCTIGVLRDGEPLTFTANAIESQTDGEYKLGMWTKDSVAGIGTMTYYDPETGVFAGLGHGVSDSATGVRMPLLSGEVTAVTITDIVRGSAGSPGELCGAFMSGVELGKLTYNSDFGIFGECPEPPILAEPVEVAQRSEVRTGSAVICTTTGGMMPKEYAIEIVTIDRNSTSPAHNMTIRITDSDLLSRTGGIVQGMSGSPIMQDGRLVGAVTHVLVNDSAMGYAVFADNMMNEYDKYARDGA
ncbi:MAG: SpoIVB peptidase [Ruminiclostridium sp.]|nr:SpoIVB peptidase [Ruminiclostridium sp.]